MDKQRKAYAKEAVRLRTQREPEDILRELYVEKRHSQQEIADALGIHRMTVSEWLREYGITRDERPAVTL